MVDGAGEVSPSLAFVPLLALLLALEVWKSKARREENGAKGGSVQRPPGFAGFRRSYVLVYSLMMAGDWMQGPYVYALYTQYGFEEGAIGKLFVAGFGSSMIFGTFVGGLADRFGRKLACLLYVLIYSISCVLKAFNNFHVLLLGRVLAGIATSLLASAFESWLVSAHMAHGFNASLLSLIFAPAVFYGNGVTAVAAGQIGHIIVDVAGLGLVAPFFVAIGFLITGGIIVATSWQENYGSAVDIPPANASTKAGESLVSASSSLPPSSQSARNGAVTAYPSVLSRALSTLSAMGGSQLLIFVDAAKLIASREHLLLLGAIQSIFEAAMYTFIFLWTPALSPSPSSPIPHGTIFACFMLACMVGSSFADILMRNEATLRVEDYMSVVFVVSAAALLPPILVHVDDPPNARVTGTFNWWLIFVGFLVYETTVGIFWPSMMKMRAALIPEELRSTLMNMYRVPLNLFVCLVLYNVGNLPSSVPFGMCVAFCVLCVFLQRRLSTITGRKAVRIVETIDNDDTPLITTSSV